VSAPNRQPNLRAAFTLVELMIVVVVVAILSAVLVSEMKGTFEGELLHSTSRSLTGALGVAYRQSVTSNQPHRLRIDATKGRFMIERRDTAGESASGFVPLENVSDANGSLDPRITVEITDTEDVEENESSTESPAEPGDEDAQEDQKDSTAILFMPDGTTEKREIHLRDRQGFGIALRLNPITARVKLVQLERK
jgi:type II secretion system protein H